MAMSKLRAFASSFSISGRRESIKALVIDTLPRWEYRFIRNALYRDPGVNVHTLLFHPELEEMGEGPGYLVKFPDRMEDLARYDVIFIGDVGLGSKGLTEEQASLLKGMVKNQASGIVFLPGYQGRQMELLKSELGDLMPVTFLNTKPEGTTQPSPSPLILTPEGRGSLLTMLADTKKYGAICRASTGTPPWNGPKREALSWPCMRRIRMPMAAFPLLSPSPAATGKSSSWERIPPGDGGAE